LVLLSLSLQWAQGKLVCLAEVVLPLGVLLLEAVPLVAAVQVQEALLPGSQVHLVDSPDSLGCSCLLDWSDS
jgi:hypothetical protein